MRIVLVFLMLGVVNMMAAFPATPVDECKKGCLDCTVLWGKHRYDGKKCLQVCQRTQGELVDRDCKHLGLYKGIPSVKATRICRKYCDDCGRDFTTNIYNAQFCHVVCEVYHGAIMDPTCGIKLFSNYPDAGDNTLNHR